MLETRRRTRQRSEFEDGWRPDSSKKSKKLNVLNLASGIPGQAISAGEQNRAVDPSRNASEKGSHTRRDALCAAKCVQGVTRKIKGPSEALLR